MQNQRYNEVRVLAFQAGEGNDTGDAAPFDEGSREPHAQCTQNDGLKHRLVVLHREELRKEVRLTDGKEGPHHNHGNVVLPRIGIVVPRETHIIGVHSGQLFIDHFKAAAQLKGNEKGHHSGDNHQNTLDQVREHHRADAAGHAVQDNGNTHHHDTDPFIAARVGGENHTAANGLSGHHGDKENQHEHCQ